MIIDATLKHNKREKQGHLHKKTRAFAQGLSGGK
jgi:hypothetical protein